MRSGVCCLEISGNKAQSETNTEGEINQWSIVEVTEFSENVGTRDTGKRDKSAVDVINTLCR